MPSLKQAYTRVVISFVVLIVGMAVAFGIAEVFNRLGDKDAAHTFGSVVGFIVVVAFSMTYLRGTAIWAIAKGHAAGLGVVLGLLGPLGLAILAAMPDFSKSG